MLKNERFIKYLLFLSGGISITCYRFVLVMTRETLYTVPLEAKPGCVNAITYTFINAHSGDRTSRVRVLRRVLIGNRRLQHLY